MTPPAHLGPSLVVALAVMVSAWPLRTLFDEATWAGPLLMTVLAVAVAGAVARRLARPPRYARAVVVLIQAAVLVVALCLVFAEGTALLGVVPTPESVGLAADLYADAVESITGNPPPAPATPGVTFVFTAGFGAIAVVADAAGVTFGRPLLAAVPLLVPYLAAVANVGAPLPWYHLVALIAAIALLLLLDRRRTLMDRAGGATRGVDDRVPTAFVLTAASVGLALVTASWLPHLPTRFVADGLGRSHGGAGQVGFSPDPDLLADLRNDDRTPVLEYTTDDPAPPPVRVGVAARYADGRWQPTSPAVAPSPRPVFAAPVGLSQDVRTETRTFSVADSRLRPPYLAAPAPVIGGSVTGARWDQDPTTQMLVTDATPSRYTITYLAIVDRRGGAEPVPAVEAVTSGAVSADDLDVSAVTPALRREVRRVTAGASTPAEQADAIQRWLREEGRFTYSLDLPPSSERDPVDAFLSTRTGYCVQFATTMILMAREQGIPARLATGFLAGTTEGTSKVVRANDAHAWPELYLDELGWVRYEPTPSVRSGPAPQYGALPEDADTGESEPTATTRPSVAPEVTATPTEAPRDRDPGATERGGTRGASAPGSLSGAVGAILLGLLALGGLLTFSPAVAWWRHRRRLRTGSSAQRIDEHWRWLTTRLTDLGIDVPPSSTVRARGDTYRRRLGDDVDQATARIVEQVETARYAAGGDAEPSDEAIRLLRADIGILTRAAWHQADLRSRLRAVLLPSDGLVSGRGSHRD